MADWCFCMTVMTHACIHSRPLGQVYAGRDAHFLVTGLAKATRYRFRVSAKNAAGTGPCSAARDLSTREPLLPPPPPVLIVCKSTSTLSLTIRWERGVPGAAAAATTYRLEIGATGTGEATKFVQVYAGVHSSFSVRESIHEFFLFFF